jgi:parallel beta-helix repeat protein
MIAAPISIGLLEADMPILRRLSRAAVFSVAMASLVGAVSASANASSGVLVITTDTTLTEDHQGPIVVAADGVTLDCAGHALTGPGTFGILVHLRSGVTVRSCDVSGFEHGINVAASTRSTVTGNTSHDNVDTGFVFDDGSFNVFSLNTAERNGGNGFQATSAASPVLEQNVARENRGTGGIAIASTMNAVIRRNTIVGNANHGIHLFASSRNELTGNTVSSNGIHGIALEGASAENLVRENTANHNAVDGFAVNDRSSRNTLTANGANHNLNGFHVWAAASHNELAGNAALRNLTGFFLHDEGSDWNSFAQNVANNNTYNGFAAALGDHNSWTDNVANHNRLLNGIALYDGSSFSTVSGCIAKGNGEFDALDMNPPEASNNWTDNNFGTTSPVGL